MTLTLRRALLLLIAGVVLAGLLPAGFMLERRLATDLEQRAREDLTTAKMIFADRNAARAETMSMHAMQLAAAPGLGEAVAAGVFDSALASVRRAGAFPGEVSLIVGPDGAAVSASPLPSDAPRGPEPWRSPDFRDLAERTRDDGTAYGYTASAGVPAAVSLWPVMWDSAWVGAAGVVSVLDDDAAATLAGLTGADVFVFDADGDVVAVARGPTRIGGDRAPATSPDSATSVGPAGLLAAIDAEGADENGVAALRLEGRDQWAAAVPLGDAGTVVFRRLAAEELAVLRPLRRNAIWAGVVALAFAIVVGGVVSGAVAAPVAGLADAADRLAAGDFERPLPDSRIADVDRLRTAFATMRTSLRNRLEELGAANAELEDRQDRLAALQSELVQRDRLAANSRLVAELAHEIRNPVANVRNCLEVVMRRLPEGSEAQELADLAINELLRMHELAERMLDLNRPPDAGEGGQCDAAEAARRIAALYGAGGDDRWPVRVDGDPSALARISSGALRQILVNLVENAREATPDGGPIDITVGAGNAVVSIDVRDRGPGVPDRDMPHIFDPFFTTKGEVNGVGLGLFVAQGTVRRFGGRIVANNEPKGGARFRIEVPGLDRKPAEASQ
jgi:signal transduction histidine kinase